MKRRGAALIGAGLGAGVMYFLDPERGKRRRALLRDKSLHLLHEGSDSLDVAARGLSHRVHGLYAKARSRFTRTPIPDAILQDRVRSRIGHLVSHPGSIEVAVREGRVRLEGPVLAREVRRLLRCVSHMRGVQAVENRLEFHERASGVPGLQGGRIASA
jgi:osmotically-inducible protein OsmY